MLSNDTAVEAVVDNELGSVKELDEDVFAYIVGIVKDVDSHGCDPETLSETVRLPMTSAPNVLLVLSRAIRREREKRVEREAHICCLC